MGNQGGKEGGDRAELGVEGLGGVGMPPSNFSCVMRTGELEMHFSGTWGEWRVKVRRDEHGRLSVFSMSKVVRWSGKVSKFF